MFRDVVTARARFAVMPPPCKEMLPNIKHSGQRSLAAPSASTSQIPLQSDRFDYLLISLPHWQTIDSVNTC